jgi:hypothetical protein
MVKSEFSKHFVMQTCIPLKATRQTLQRRGKQKPSFIPVRAKQINSLYHKRVKEESKLIVFQHKNYSFME